MSSIGGAGLYDGRYWRQVGPLITNHAFEGSAAVLPPVINIAAPGPGFQIMLTAVVFDYAGLAALATSQIALAIINNGADIWEARPWAFAGGSESEKGFQNAPFPCGDDNAVDIRFNAKVANTVQTINTTHYVGAVQ